MRTKTIKTPKIKNKFSLIILPINADTKPKMEKSVIVLMPNIGSSFLESFLQRSLSIPGKAPTREANNKRCKNTSNICCIKIMY